MKKKNLIVLGIILFSTFLFVQCSKDDDMENAEKGKLTVKITDAPTDDTNIKGTFITVSDIKIDGKSVEGFAKQTIEISAYQNGNAKLLVSEEVAAKSYNSVTLVLDHESDASGNAPGCYVLTEDNGKHDLFAESGAEGVITVSKTFNVETSSETSLVIDFDLRKAVIRNPESPESSNYKFVTSAEMENSVRVVMEDECGDLSGKVNHSLNADAQVFIYIYKKGEFNASAEQSGSGTSNVLFANAVSSAKVENDGSYKLSFIEEGDYEVHLTSYEKSGANRFNFKGFLNANSSIGGLLLNSVSVSANSNVTLNIEVLGLL
jgi:hypothetical protein